MVATHSNIFVNGDWVATREGRLDEVIDPATGQVMAQVASAGAADMNDAVDAAAAAFPAWGATSPAERSAALSKLADAIDANRDELIRLESQNVGKPISVTPLDIDFMIDNLRFFAGAIRAMTTQAPGEYLSGYTSLLRREPLGVAGLIAPWNYPIMMAGWKIGPALAAGNTVVLKPSELTPLSALKLAEIAADIFPAGVLNVVTGDGEHAGAALVANPKVAIVSLTGETTTGQLIMRNAADTLKRVHLELGGKAPVVVFDDADIEAAIAGVKIFGYFNAGQDCTASTRVLVGETVYDDFVSGMAEAAKSLTMGDPQNEATELGPVVSAEQRDRIAGFVERAVAAGATVATGGNAGSGSGFFYEPTVVAGPTQDSEIVQREVFGPVVTVQRFTDEAQALALGQRRRLRVVGLGVDQGRRSRPSHGQRHAIRHGLGERSRTARLRDAPRRVQAVRRRQGHVDVLHRGLHRAQARHDQDLLMVTRAGHPIDDIDRAIIEQLQADGRLPYTKLGTAVGLSEAAVRQRLQRLIDSGTIQIVAVTNPMSLGMRRMAMIGVKVEGDTEKIAAKLQTFPDIDYLVITAGSFDLMCEVVVEDDRALVDLGNRIRAVAGVRGAETFIYLELVKQTYTWGAR